MTPFISIIIPTHNPRMDYLRRVLEALHSNNDGALRSPFGCGVWGEAGLDLFAIRE